MTHVEDQSELSNATDTVSLTVDLPRELVERLNALGARANGGIGRLMLDMLSERIPYLEWKFTKIQEAIDDLDAGGSTYSNDEVKAWIETLGTSDERSLPG